MDNKILKTFETFNKLSSELKEIIVGKNEQIDKTLACLLAKGHILLEDMPGVGKTTLASALASAIRGSFSRIQFTSDLLPFDIIGSKIYRRQTEIFEFEKGPVFANIVLADELNRTSPKTQSALLQVMNEASISIDKTTYEMPKPFFVIATQNPCGSGGTYPLPESQLDRFMMRINLGYPNAEQEKKILLKNLTGTPDKTPKTIIEQEQILEAQNYICKISINEKIINYIVAIMTAIRKHEEVLQPASSRGSIALMRASQAIAFLQGKDYVTIDMVKSIACEVLSHRITLKKSLKLLDKTTSPEWLSCEILQKVNVE